MLNMIIWIFLIAAILLVLYYLGYLLISIVRKSFKSSASKQSPQIVAKPPVSLEEPPAATTHHIKISMPYFIFAIIIALSFCFIIYLYHFALLFIKNSRFKHYQRKSNEQNLILLNLIWNIKSTHQRPNYLILILALILVSQTSTI